MPSARIVTSAILFLACLPAAAPGQIADAQGLELPEREFSFLDYVVMSGPIGMSGFAAMLLAFGLLATAPYLAGGNRRRMYLLMGTAAFVGAGGYVMFDWKYIEQDLSLRDAQAVRDDCEKLLKLHASATDRQTVWLVAHELPASFVTLGASDAAISSGSVRICTFPSQESCLRGYLYDPKGTHRGGWVRLRSSWHRDFYLYPEF